MNKYDIWAIEDKNNTINIFYCLSRLDEQIKLLLYCANNFKLIEKCYLLGEIDIFIGKKKESELQQIKRKLKTEGINISDKHSYPEDILELSSALEIKMHIQTLLDKY